MAINENQEIRTSEDVTNHLEENRFDAAYSQDMERSQINFAIYFDLLCYRGTHFLILG